MMGNRKLLLVWVWMLLVASLCPGAHCKRGRGGGLSARAPPSKSKGSSNVGLKVAGAAAAGAIGGAAIGYGLGSLGRPRYGHEDDRRYHPDGHGYHNRSDFQNRSYRSTGSSEHVTSILLTLGAVAHFFMWG